ncbi:MAG: sulfatase [Bacteroidota bacterium]
MNQLLLTPLFLFFLWAVSCSSVKEEPTSSKRPNILFIAVDDLRPELNCFGRSHIHSPHIDRLAAEGTIFTRTYCQVPVCGASRASLLSGVRPTAQRFLTYYTRLEEDFPGIPSLPQYLKQNGYISLSRGKVFHHADDQTDAWTEAPWNPPMQNPNYGWFDYVAQSSLDVVKAHPDFEPGGKWKGIRGPAFEFPDVPDSSYKDGKLALKAIEDLEQLATQGQPFFLALGFLKPHLPFNAPKKYWDLYDPDSIPYSPNNFRPKDVPNAAIHNSGELRNYGLIPSKGPVSRDTAQLLTQGYYACISYTDAQIGLVMDALEETGLAENTIVILWGDHGWNLEDHTMWCKHANFETSMRAPLIIKAPGYGVGQQTSALTEFVDIYPTLIDLVGLPQPQHLQGQSLTPLLSQPNQSVKSAIYSRFNKGESVKTDRYVYTEWIDPENQAVYARMLYDHENDPLENVNVAEEADYQGVREELSALLQVHRREIE